MKIVTLVENTACREDLAAEHGLSLYIEAAGRRILFDMGQGRTFAGNAEKLGIDLSRVDLAILSHGHYDHGGGLETFLKINGKAPVYLSRFAFEKHYNAIGKNIGLEPTESDRLIFTEDFLDLGQGMCLRSGNEYGHQPESYGLTVEQDGLLVAEDFRHEQYLLIQEKGKTVCVSGCSHKGILQIVGWFRPDVLVGGFHFKAVHPEDPFLLEAAKGLMAIPAVYYTGHCTGQAQYEKMKTVMGKRLFAISTGTVLEI